MVPASWPSLDLTVELRALPNQSACGTEIQLIREEGR